MKKLYSIMFENPEDDAKGQDWYSIELIEEPQLIDDDILMYSFQFKNKDVQIFMRDALNNYIKNQREE